MCYNVVPISRYLKFAQRGRFSQARSHIISSFYMQPPSSVKPEKNTKGVPKSDGTKKVVSKGDGKAWPVNGALALNANHSNNEKNAVATKSGVSCDFSEPGVLCWLFLLARELCTLLWNVKF